MTKKNVILFVRLLHILFKRHFFFSWFLLLSFCLFFSWTVCFSLKYAAQKIRKPHYEAEFVQIDQSKGLNINNQSFTSCKIRRKWKNYLKDQQRPICEICKLVIILVLNNHSVMKHEMKYEKSVKIFRSDTLPKIWSNN